MAHAIWKGNISFGLVNIPVGLYSAEKKEEKLSFNLLDKHDMAPVGYKRFNKQTGEEVQAGDLVKGYEYEEGKYVVLSEEDFKRADPKATQTVEITDFVDLSKIPPSFFEKPYYLAPTGKSSKSYALLREVLKRTNKAGVARVVIHSKEYVGVVFPYGRILVLDLLRYPHEIREPESLETPEEDIKKLGISEKELDMAERLVEGMYSEWAPEKYHDTYHEELVSYIEKKIAAGETAAIPEAPTQPEAARKGEVIDLMSLLKKSLEKTEAGRERKKAASE